MDGNQIFPSVLNTMAIRNVASAKEYHETRMTMATLSMGVGSYTEGTRSSIQLFSAKPFLRNSGVVTSKTKVPARRTRTLRSLVDTEYGIDLGLNGERAVSRIVSAYATFVGNSRLIKYRYCRRDRRACRNNYVPVLRFLGYSSRQYSPGRLSAWWQLEYDYEFQNRIQSRSAALRRFIFWIFLDGQCVGVLSNFWRTIQSRSKFSSPFNGSSRPGF